MLGFRKKKLESSQREIRRSERTSCRRYTGQSLIHSFGLMRRERDRFSKIASELKSLSLKAMYRWSIQGPVLILPSSLGILGVVGMGAYLLESDPTFTTGKFFAFLLYANMFYEPIRQLVGINNLIAAGKGFRGACF